MDLAKEIVIQITSIVANSNTVTKYRPPLVGFASAHDPLFNELKSIIGPYHLHPKDILSNAETVIAFFLPFQEEIVIANRKSEQVTKEWCIAYIETNRLIQTICESIRRQLSAAGIRSAYQKATHNFSQVDLTAAWSHKSAAYIAGLGGFGKNKMLITSSGCAGRLGSMVISAFIKPTGRKQENYCLHYKNGKCLYCVGNCPSGALREDALDKKKCYEYLLYIDQQYPDLELCDACGKCAVGPCALFK